MFTGNTGKAHSVDAIISVAALLKDDPRYKFHIVGSGSEFDNVKRLADFSHPIMSSSRGL